MKWIDSSRGRPLLEYAASGILGARIERTEPRRTWLRVFVRLGGWARWENGSKKIEPREQCAPRLCIAWANAEPNGRPRCDLQEAVKRTSRRYSRFNVGPGQFTRQVGFEDSLE